MTSVYIAFPIPWWRDTFESYLSDFRYSDRGDGLGRRDLQICSTPGTALSLHRPLARAVPLLVARRWDSTQLRLHAGRLHRRPYRNPFGCRAGTIFDTAVSRVEEIALEICCASLVSMLVLPRSAALPLPSRTDAWLADVRSLGQSVFGHWIGSGLRARASTRAACG